MDFKELFTRRDASKKKKTSCACFAFPHLVRHQTKLPPAFSLSCKNHFSLRCVFLHNRPLPNSASTHAQTEVICYTNIERCRRCGPGHTRQPTPLCSAGCRHFSGRLAQLPHKVPGPPSNHCRLFPVAETYRAEPLGTQRGAPGDATRCYDDRIKWRKTAATTTAIAPGVAIRHTIALASLARTQATQSRGSCAVVMAALGTAGRDLSSVIPTAECCEMRCRSEKLESGWRVEWHWVGRIGPNKLF